VIILCAATAGTVGGIVLSKQKIEGRDHSQRAMLLLGAFPLTLVAVYLVRVPLIFPWYWPLSLCPMALLAWSQFLESGFSMTSWRGKRRPPFPELAVAAGLLLACAAIFSAGCAFCGRLELSPWILENARTRTYLRIGTVLNQRCPDAVVAAPEIGALGWTFFGKILDGGGLASPEVLPFHPLQVPEERPMGGLGSIPGRAVAAFRPDVVVSMEIFSTDFTAKAATLPGLSDYKLWWKEPVFGPDLPPSLPGELWGSRWILVFARPGRSRMGDSVSHLRPEILSRDRRSHWTLSRVSRQPIVCSD
jgi:hypothetical protein